MTIETRKATPDDLPHIYRLVCELENDMLPEKVFAHIFGKNLDNPDCFYEVAAVEGKVIGFISLHIQQLLHHCGPVGEIQEFCIDPDYRGKGIGKLLMSQVRKYADTAGVKAWK